MPVGINSQGYIAPDSQQAADEFFPHYASVMGRIGRERGWPPLSRSDYEMSRGREGALFVGSPDEVAEKIVLQHSYFGHDRFLMQIGLGALPQRELMRAIELLGTEVAPRVHKEIRSV